MSRWIGDFQTAVLNLGLVVSLLGGVLVLASFLWGKKKPHST